MVAIGGLLELVILATAGMAILYYGTMWLVVGVGLLFKRWLGIE